MVRHPGAQPSRPKAQGPSSGPGSALSKRGNVLFFHTVSFLQTISAPIIPHPRPKSKAETFPGNLHTDRPGLCYTGRDNITAGTYRVKRKSCSSPPAAPLPACGPPRACGRCFSSGELLAHLPGLADLCQPETLALCSIDSTDMSPAHWLDMARAIEENYDRYDGFSSATAPTPWPIPRRPSATWSRTRTSPSSSPAPSSPSPTRSPTPKRTCGTVSSVPWTPAAGV